MSAPDVSPMNLPPSAFDLSAVNDVGANAQTNATTGAPMAPADPTQAPSAGGVNPLPASATQSSQVGDIAQGVAQAAQADQPTQGPQQPQPFWRSVLMGALSGIASHLKGSAEGLYAGGIPGAIAGAADPSRAGQVYDNRGVVNQANADRSVALARQASDSADLLEQHIMQNGQMFPEQLAILHTNLVDLQRQYDLAPKSWQDVLDQQEAKYAEQLKLQGAEVAQSGIDNLEDAQHIALGMNQSDSKATFGSYIPLRDADGQWEIVHIATPDQPLRYDATLPYMKADGTLGEYLIKAGSMTQAQFAAAFPAAINGALKSSGALAVQETKNAGNVDVARIRAQAMSGSLSVDAAAAMVLSGNLNPSDLSKRGNYNVNVISRANQMSQDAGGQGFNAVAAENTAATQKAAQKAFTSGPQGQQLTAIDTAREHMHTFIQTADALDNGDVTGLNRLSQLLGTQFGSDKATNFAIAKEAFAGEVGKSLAGANVGTTDRNELREKILNSSSPTQLKGFAATADSLLAGKQVALKRSYDAAQQGHPNFGANPTKKPASANPYLPKGGQQ